MKGFNPPGCSLEPILFGLFLHRLISQPHFYRSTCKSRVSPSHAAVHSCAGFPGCMPGSTSKSSFSPSHAAELRSCRSHPLCSPHSPINIVTDLQASQSCSSFFCDSESYTWDHLVQLWVCTCTPKGHPRVHLCSITTIPSTTAVGTLCGGQAPATPQSLLFLRTRYDFVGECTCRGTGGKPRGSWRSW